MKAPGESFCFSPVFNLPDLGRDFGNFGMDQLRDMGRTQEVSFMRFNYRHAGVNVRHAHIKNYLLQHQLLSKIIFDDHGTVKQH